MIEHFSFWSVLTVARSVLLIAGICALAVWAVRQPDKETALLKRLMGRRGDDRCADDERADGGGIGT